MSETPEQFFDRQSSTYSDAIERCVPRYREMLRALCSAVPADHAPARILELGCGTGHLTSELTRRWPEAEVTAVDLSAEALEEARKHLGAQPRVHLRQVAMEDLEMDPARFDLVVSSIAIHHLTDLDKARLFVRVHDALAPHGVFAFADQFAGATPHLDRIHKQEWRRLSLDQGLSEAEWQSWREHELHHDHHSSLTWHLGALAEAGFGLVDCVWRHLLWTVLFAQHQGGGSARKVQDPGPGIAPPPEL